MIETNFKASYKYKCKCGRNNHIHPEINIYLKKAMYYCGECGHSYYLKEAVEVIA